LEGEEIVQQNGPCYISAVCFALSTK